MGFYWSMGISFSDKQIAENCQATLKKINLSDGRIVNLYSNILSQTNFDTQPDYVLEIFPEEMEIDGNRRNLEFPFFGEIRDQLFQFIKELKLDFKIAFCECEGADRVTNENIINWINEDGIGEIRNREVNDLGFDPRNYIPKRYFDGLILSNNEYKRLKKQHIEFEYFKDGYVWLPIRNSH
ncbi:hypothetical protein [Flavobacterium pedocola]